MSDAQLTIDGREVELGTSEWRRTANNPQGLSRNQRAVIQFARDHGDLIGPTQAGRIVHERRRTACWEPYDPFADVPGRVGCCRHACSDGLAVLHALERRGILEKVSRGIYAIVPPPEEDHA